MRYAKLPTLDHPEVQLRPLAVRDLAPWAAYLMDPRVYEHTSWNLRHADELQPYLSPTQAPDSLLRLALARRSDDALVGSIGFHTVSSVNRSAELAYDLAPDFWGRGIARAAARCLTDWAHAQAGLRRVQATVLVSNRASIKVIEACGFEREGLLRSYRQVRERAGDFWIYSHLCAQAEA